MSNYYDACKSVVYLQPNLDEYSEYVENKNDETQSVEKEETNDDEQSKLILEDMNTETSTALVQNDDPDYIKHKGCE